MSQEDETIAVALAFELLQEDCMNDELLAVYMQQDQGTWTRVHEPCNTSLNTAAATLEEARYGYGHPPSPCSMHYLAEPSLSSPSPSPPSVQDMTGDVLLAALLQDAENEEPQSGEEQSVRGTDHAEERKLEHVTDALGARARSDEDYIAALPLDPSRRDSAGRVSGRRAGHTRRESADDAYARAQLRGYVPRELPRSVSSRRARDRSDGSMFIRHAQALLGNVQSAQRRSSRSRAYMPRLSDDEQLAAQLQEFGFGEESHRELPIPFRRNQQPDIDRMSYTELLELGEAMGRVVVAPTDQERNALPTQPFTAGCASKERECCICKCEYEEGEEVTTLPCFHTFHKACIMRWLENHNTCPVDMTVVRVSISMNVSNGTASRTTFRHNVEYYYASNKNDNLCHCSSLRRLKVVTEDAQFTSKYYEF